MKRRLDGPTLNRSEKPVRPDMSISEAPAPLILGADHAGYELKEKIEKHLQSRGIPTEDVGTHGIASVDYPDFGIAVARGVSEGRFPRGILVCGTGIGMSMTANRFSRVRAALCHDIFTARMSRLHNNANVLVLGGRVIGDALALEMVDTWLETPFEGGRHQRRLDRFDRLQTGPP